MPWCVGGCKMPDPVGVWTFRVANFRLTRFGRQFPGLPVKPRPSRGFRRHVRRMKARKNG
jgi:hypothetical protein